MQWKCLPVPRDVQGKPAIHSTTIYKVFAKWADYSSLWQAFVASVWHLAVEKQLDRSVLHRDGPTPGPKKGGWHWLLGPQAREGGEGHRHDRQQLRLSRINHRLPKGQPNLALWRAQQRSYTQLRQPTCYRQLRSLTLRQRWT